MTVQVMKSMRHMLSRIFISFSAIALTGACMSTGSTDEEQPPEREFDQSTAWERMEEAAAEVIDGLPEFPGFEVRHMQALDCFHNGQVDEEYVNFELSYQFSREVSDELLVRETYLDFFRDQWRESGYDVHRDQTSGTGKYHSLEARRPDGINYWYRVASLVGLTIQSGCLKAVEGWSPECPEPLGGVTPENDQAAKRYCKADDPTEKTDAIAPFEGTQAAGPLGVIPWSHGTDEAAKPVLDRYQDEL